MSNIVTSELRRRRLEIGFAAKSILLLLGDLASDDGGGIYASKPTIAKQLETDKKTVIRHVNRLIETGYLIEVGTRARSVKEYRIDVKKVFSAPMVEKSPVAVSHSLAQDVDRQTQDVGGGCEPPVAVSHPKGGCEPPLPVAVSHPNQKKPKLTLARASAVEQFGSDAVASAEAWCDQVRRGTFVPRHAMTISVVDAMIAMGLATCAQARHLSLHFSEKLEQGETS